MPSSDEHIMLIAEDDVTGFEAMFEDDGRAAYAYLIRDDEIVADVWLYNSGGTPPMPEWDGPESLPCRNPADYVSNETVIRVGDDSDVVFSWNHDESGGLESLEIKVRGRVLGRLEPGSMPGWAALATRDGPLARVLLPISTAPVPTPRFG